MDNPETLPKLYREIADWWPILSTPEEYAEEAELYRKALVTSASAPIHTLLELGSGGGSNASHLKKHFQMTLVDLSPGMLEVSRKLNPECEHLQGDMRSVRLGRALRRRIHPRCHRLYDQCRRSPASADDGLCAPQAGRCSFVCARPYPRDFQALHRSWRVRRRQPQPALPGMGMGSRSGGYHRTMPHGVCACARGR